MNVVGITALCLVLTRHTALNLLLTDDFTLPESRALATCLSVIVVKLKGSVIFPLYVSRQSNSSLISASDQQFVSQVC